MSPAGARFTPLQRLLHWLMAALILTMLFIGVGMVSTVTPKYLTLVQIHKPLGAAILVLALIRLAVRLKDGAPALPADLPEPIKLSAKLSHYVLYALMIAMPTPMNSMVRIRAAISQCSRRCSGVNRAPAGLMAWLPRSCGDRRPPPPCGGRRTWRRPTTAPRGTDRRKW